MSRLVGGCRDQKMDIAILADVSKSMTPEERSDQIKLINKLVEKKGVSFSGNHFAFMTFAKEVIIESNFNDQSYYEEGKLKDLVQEKSSVIPKFWGTRIDLAMDLAAKELFSEQGGDRPDAKNVLVMFTDGKPVKTKWDERPDIPFEDFLEALESKDVSVIVVAVGEKLFQEKTTMSKIAGTPKGELLLYPNFDDLPGHLDDIVKATCVIDGGYTEWSESECSVSCGEGKKTLTRTCTNPTPFNGGKDCSELGPAKKTVKCNEGLCREYSSSFKKDSSVTTSELKNKISEICFILRPHLYITSLFHLILSFVCQYTVFKTYLNLGPPCTAGLDIGIVLDKSKSIKIPNLEKVITFLGDLVKKFNPAPKADHFGLITFNEQAKLAFSFADSKYHSKKDLLRRIANEPLKLNLQTRTDLALKLAKDKLFTKAGGDRPDKPNVMIVLTDGRPTHPDKSFNFKEFAKKLAKKFKEKDVSTVAVGIGKNVQKETLRQIAGGGSVVEVDDFDKLKGTIEEIKSKACSGEVT
ncbi:unnamed protein product [Pocillopora meandrina]|uniref:VWFA domain-containing protein n=1 Tax=Pocillopora meandrina TaxID=46732 RepID=A0AAU9X2G9_9CNID|nr:unnamed protein product [Pocillopora meandrina]